MAIPHSIEELPINIQKAYSQTLIERVQSTLLLKLTKGKTKWLEKTRFF